MDAHSHRARKQLVSRRGVEGIVTRASSKNIATTCCKGSLLIKGAALFLYPVAERRNPSCRNACDVTPGIVIGLKSILGVKSRTEALEIMNVLSRFWYIRYMLDEKTKKLEFAVID